jgi:hypothetical protein
MPQEVTLFLFNASFSMLTYMAALCMKLSHLKKEAVTWFTFARGSEGKEKRREMWRLKTPNKLFSVEFQRALLLVFIECLIVTIITIRTTRTWPNRQKGYLQLWKLCREQCDVLLTRAQRCQGDQMAGSLCIKSTWKTFLFPSSKFRECV